MGTPAGGSSERTLLCAIDVGTTGARVILFDPAGTIVSSHYREYGCLHPKPAWVEQDAESWWRAIANASGLALEKAGEDAAAHIAGIAITNQRETIVPVDADGVPLHNARVWQDRRTTAECATIRERIGEDDIYRITGLTVDPYFSAPKMLWLNRNEPELFARTHKFLLVHDYLVWKLAGVFATDYSNASRTMCFDINRLRWSERLLDAYGIDARQLPSVHPSGTVLGAVTEEAAAATGLREGTPVIAGGGDQQCAALGVGVTRTGRLKATTGTGTFILSYLDEPVFDPQKRVLCSVSAIPDRWVLEASIFTTGAVYRWFRDNFSRTEVEACKGTDTDPYELLNASIERAPPGAGGVIHLPHLVGAGAPYWNPAARGVFFGLALGHSRDEFARAIMEGIGFEVRKNLAVMRELGVAVDELRVTGGATKGAVFNRIQSDIIGRPVLKPTVGESTALGAAILAGVGSGVYDDVSDAADSMIRIAARYEPDDANAARYDALYELNCALYEAIENADLYERLAQYEAEHG